MSTASLTASPQGILFCKPLGPRTPPLFKYQFRRVEFHTFRKPIFLASASASSSNGSGNRRFSWERLGRSLRVGSDQFITKFSEPAREEEGGARDVSTNQDINQNLDLNQAGQHRASQSNQRVTSGLVIGILCAAVVLAGGWAFTIGLAVLIYMGAHEYFELVQSGGIAAEMTPPPQYLSRVCSIICACMPIITLYFGHMDISVTSAAFIVAAALLLQRRIPRFSQLSSTIFGLFYCGYLPCFWVKLRCSLSVPALNTNIGRFWPVLLGGQAHWTVGLVATLIAISCIVAADTYAYLGGKAFGRTPLINVSPKKTWEGAIAGLAGCVATSVVLSKLLSWPKSWISIIAFGVLNFFGSLLGDLTESMIKRDAGVKDSGTVIPGHGGILDRADSYIFTGAIAYSFVKTMLPLYGV